MDRSQDNEFEYGCELHLVVHVPLCASPCSTRPAVWPAGQFGLAHGQPQGHGRLGHCNKGRAHVLAELGNTIA